MTDKKYRDSSGFLSPYPMMSLNEAQYWLTEAVATQGADFVYMRDTEPDGADCSYFCVPDAPDDDPQRITSCLIGVAMRLAGRVVGREMEGITPTGLQEVWNLSEKAARYLAIAQRAQDDGKTWGYALERANRVMFGGEGK